ETQPLGSGAPTALLSAAWIGLVAGYLDLGILVVKKRLLDHDFFRLGDDFVWITPAGVTALVLLPGAVIALAARMRRAGVSVGVAVGLLSFVGFLDLSARLPLAFWASLLLCGGLAVQSGQLAARGSPAFLQLMRRTSPLLVGVLLTIALATFC